MADTNRTDGQMSGAERARLAAEPPPDQVQLLAEKLHREYKDDGIWLSRRMIERVIRDSAELRVPPAARAFDDEETTNRLMQAFCDPGSVTSRGNRDSSEPEPVYAWQRRAVRATIENIWEGE